MRSRDRLCEDMPHQHPGARRQNDEGRRTKDEDGAEMNAVLLLWVGFYLGFWSCAIVVAVVKYGVWPRRK